MIDYRLDDLGWFEFEQLIQALLKFKLGLGIEAWGGHGDNGRDAYFSGSLRYPADVPANGPFVFQAKFVAAANAAGAKPSGLITSAVSKECEEIRSKLRSGSWDAQPSFYALFTNAPVRPKVRAAIKHKLKITLPTAECFVHDGNDICQWLRLAPELIKSFPQLISIRDFESLLTKAVNSAIITRSEAAISRAKDYTKLFIPTTAYYTAEATLKRNHFVILEGPPEMGKTTIGRMISLGQVFSGWDALECRNPSEVLKCYNKDAKQAFVADDFFGRTEYDPSRVGNWQDELPHIIPLLLRLV